jgi:hypothetical protein
MARSRKSKAAPFNVAEIATMARSNPYVQALLNDDKLRKNVRMALESGQRAYGRLSNGKVEAKALLEDKRLHADLGKALGAARDVTITITNTKRKRARRRLSFGRVLILTTVGVGVAVATSEKLRSKALDMLFGAEEEFQYTPPPNSSSAESTTTVGAA